MNLAEIILIIKATPSSTFILSFIAILILAYVAQTFYQWKRLSHIPGPFWASLSRFWLFSQAWNERVHVAVRDVCEEYGSLARIGPNDLVTDDPILQRKMNAVRSSYVRSEWYGSMRLDPERDNLLSMRDEDAHMTLRNKMAAGYSGKENESMEGTIERNIARLIKLIEQKYISTGTEYRPMDLAAKGQYFTLDVISDLAFGEPFGYLDQDDDVYDFIKIVETFLPIMIIVGMFPSLVRLYHSRLLRGLFPKDTDKLGFGAFIGIAKRLTAERFKPGAKVQRDMMGSFIRHGLTQEEAEGEALLQVIAGSDTTAATIRVVLLNLLTSPLIYHRLQSEIDSAATSAKISSPITDSEAREMPYLQAVIKEGLRIVPPVTGISFKTVPKGGDTINGIFVPEGTNIGLTYLAMHHSKQIFGDDADIFRPERWLEAEGERLAVMKGVLDLVFNHGRFQCLGKPVALMELNKIFVELLRRFDFAIVNADKPAKLLNRGIWVVKDFWVRITRR